MFGVRYDLTMVIETLSPLHVGTGETSAIDGVGSATDGNVAPEVNRIARDHKDRPYIPGSTIKGLLRRLAERQPGAPIERLFGERNDKATRSGGMGRLLVRGGVLEETPSTAEYPYASKAFKALGPGVFVAARTSIDAQSGTAADHKLFFQEMVAPHARFRVSLALTGTETALAGDLSALLGLLALLAAPDGVACGKGQSAGGGRLRLVEKTLEVTKRTISADGKLQRAPAEAALPDSAAAVAVEHWTGSFRCEGPFIVIDASRTRKKTAGGDERDDAPAIVAQKAATNRPLIAGASLAGACRARAAWLAECGGEEVGDAETIVRSREDIGRLTPVQRLFGVTGFKGMASITRLAVETATPWTLTSVKLDRFSGAPVDNRLFGTSVFVDTRFELGLSLDDRGGVATPTAADVALFRRLTRSLESDGLELGHGVNKGFGWFQHVAPGDRT